jgi:probable rRNA maturation factor
MIEVAVQYAWEEAGVPSARAIKAWIRAALGQRHPPASICVRVVGEAEARTVNKRYRGRDYATNVLSFPAEALPFLDAPPLGDIVLCAPVIAREAAEQGKSLDAHWAHLIVHGVLHLKGFAHDDERQAAVMEQRETSILNGLGYPDPYLRPSSA